MTVLAPMETLLTIKWNCNGDWLFVDDDKTLISFCKWIKWNATKKFYNFTVFCLLFLSWLCLALVVKRILRYRTSEKEMAQHLWNTVKSNHFLGNSKMNFNWTQSHKSIHHFVSEIIQQCWLRWITLFAILTTWKSFK